MKITLVILDAGNTFFGRVRAVRVQAFRFDCRPVPVLQFGLGRTGLSHYLMLCHFICRKLRRGGKLRCWPVPNRHRGVGWLVEIRCGLARIAQRTRRCNALCIHGFNHTVLIGPGRGSVFLVHFSRIFVCLRKSFQSTGRSGIFTVRSLIG